MPLDEAEQTLFTVSPRQRGGGFVPLSIVVQQFFERSQRDEERGWRRQPAF